MWKLRVIKKKMDGGRCLSRFGKEDSKNVLMSCTETRKWRTQFLNRKWRNVSDKVASKKILRCTNKDQIIR
jgi:hypothetical protein